MCVQNESPQNVIAIYVLMLSVWGTFVSCWGGVHEKLMKFSGIVHGIRHADFSSCGLNCGRLFKVPIYMWFVRFFMNSFAIICQDNEQKKNHSKIITKCICFAIIHVLFFGPKFILIHWNLCELGIFRPGINVERANFLKYFIISDIGKNNGNIMPISNVYKW